MRLEDVLSLILAARAQTDSRAKTNESNKPTASIRPKRITQPCKHCGAAIRWFKTAANGAKAALEEKPGTYIVNEHEEAEFVGDIGGNYFYHYEDPTCPGTPKKAEQPDSEAEEYEFDALSRELGLTMPTGA